MAFNKNQLRLDIFRAYFDARKNKRNKINSLAFEIDYEKELFKLADDIWNYRYEPEPSICFIVDRPVKREIFAASFRDRVVHHLIFNYINPCFERRFINDCYSCRQGKGTLYGIRRLEHFIRSCSENYKRDCYILKLDIQGYFMSINRRILYNQIKSTLKRIRERERESKIPLELLLFLVKQTIFCEPTKNCQIKGSRNDWLGLPKSKSLFFARSGCGLPIGNLTSQLFANIYLNDFDHFAKNCLSCRYYGRYVDDFVFVHKNKRFLKSIIPCIREYLFSKLLLKLHSKKIYFQHYSKGVSFLGAFINPYRTYILNRIKGNFYEKIKEWNKISVFSEKMNQKEAKKIITSANSYLGLMKHFKTKKLRKKIVNGFHPDFWKIIQEEDGILKLR